MKCTSAGLMTFLHGFQHWYIIFQMFMNGIKNRDNYHRHIQPDLHVTRQYFPIPSRAIGSSEVVGEDAAWTHPLTSAAAASLKSDPKPGRVASYCSAVEGRMGEGRGQGCPTTHRLLSQLTYRVSALKNYSKVPFWRTRVFECFSNLSRLANI